MSHHDDDQSLAARVQKLEDIEAIRALKYRYALGSDACLSTPSRDNAIALASLFTESGVGVYGPFGRYEGRAALINAFENVLPGAVGWSRHYITNPIIDVHGDEAKGSWYFLVHAVPKAAPPGTPTVTFYGMYQDAYVRTAEGWRFSMVDGIFIDPPK